MHPEPSSLALHALGEPVLSQAQLRHVANCDVCMDEARTLARPVSLARGPMVTADDSGPGPSPRVWASIAGELGLSGTSPAVAAGRSVALGRTPAPAPPAHRSRSRPRTTGARPRTTGTRLRRLLPPLAAAAAAAVVAVVGTVAVLSQLASSQSQIALQARLAPAAVGVTGSGDVRVSDSEQGRVLTVDLDDPGTDAANREVWLIDLATGRMVSLGYLSANHRGSFTVPQGLDLATYDVVDISDEPDDGNPAHSGTSLLRGTLAA